MADRRKGSPVEWWRWRRQIGPSLDAVCLAGNGGYIDFLSDPRLRKHGPRAFRQVLIPEGEMWLNYTEAKVKCAEAWGKFVEEPG